MLKCDMATFVSYILSYYMNSSYHKNKASELVRPRMERTFDQKKPSARHKNWTKENKHNQKKNKIIFKQNPISY